MGKITSWLTTCFGCKKTKEKQTDQENSVVSNINNSSNGRRHGDDQSLRRKEQYKQAISTVVTAIEAAEAAIASAATVIATHRRLIAETRITREHRNLAATKIQSVYRGHLARRAHKALKSLVKVQALFRGYIVRKRIQAFMRAIEYHVMDLQVQGFIHECLLPAAQRLIATELLKDPFLLSPEGLKGDNKCESGVCPCAVLPESIKMSQPDSQVSTNNGSSYGKALTLSTADPLPVVLESSRSTVKIRLQLRGKRINQKTVSFNLRIADLHSPLANSFEFLFDLKSDDAFNIPSEMVHRKDLMYRDVPVVVGLLDSMLLELEPTWMPCTAYYNAANGASGFNRETPRKCRRILPLY